LKEYVFFLTRGIEMKKFRKIINNERGQGMLEYVLLIFIVLGLVVAFKSKITGIFTNATDQIGQKSSSVFSDGQ
jgi:Flp pilus assembly pilin Flp